MEKRAKTETEFEENAASISSIDKLNDDCFLQIFQYLPIADRIRLERVSKKWQNLSKISWSNFNSLDFRKITWGLPTDYFHKSIRVVSWLDTDILNKISQLCGRYLTNISLPVKSFQTISHFNPKIRELELFDSCSSKVSSREFLRMVRTGYYCTCTRDDWEETFNWIESNSQKITKFHVHFKHTDHKDEDLARLLDAMKKLQTLYIASDKLSSKLIGTCLHQLSFETIEEIGWSTKTKLSNDVLPSVIRKCKKLKTFYVKAVNQFSGIESIFIALSSQATSLKYLFLISESLKTKLEYSPSLFSSLSKLINLEKINVASCSDFVDDRFLEIIGKSCKKLIHLNISVCTDVTDNGIDSIANLTNLRYLWIMGLTQLENPSLEKMIFLEILDCSLTNIKVETLQRFLRQACLLKKIDISNILPSSHEHEEISFKAVVEAIRRRDSNSVFDLYTSILQPDKHILEEKPSSLNIIHGPMQSVDQGKFGFQNVNEWFDVKYPEISFKPSMTENE